MNRADVVALIGPLCEEFGVDPLTVNRIVIAPDQISIKYVRNGCAEWAGVTLTDD